MKLRYIFPVTLALSAAPAFADQAFANEALPLAQIVAGLETRYDIQFIDDILWEDAGHWGIAFFTKDGAEVTVKIDPVTGQTLA